MKKHILSLLLFLNFGIMLHAQNDFFPLMIDNQWNYSYKSVEKNYYDISFMYQMTIDSGNVQFTVADSSFQDSVIVWTMQEKDNIERQIQDFYYNTDTTFSINTNSTFQLFEYLDSLHTIKSKSNFEVFTFPVKWERFSTLSSTTPINRYSKDSSPVIIKENIFLVANYSDSLLFLMDKGLDYAQSVISHGPNTPYFYKWEASLSSFITNIEDRMSKAPQAFMLYQNYPNPFNPVTFIIFTISERTNVTLTISNALGQVITTLLNEEKTPGNYKVRFTPSNISSGLLIYQLKTSSGIINKKMLYIK